MLDAINLNIYLYIFSPNILKDYYYMNLPDYPSCNLDTLGRVEHCCSTIIVVFASAGEVVHSNKILMQQSMYLDGIMAKGSTFKRSQGEPSLS